MYQSGLRIYNALKEKSITHKNIYYCTNLKEAVDLAFKITNKHKIVLLSPASASYDSFKNLHRGKCFQTYIEEYEASV